MPTRHSINASKRDIFGKSLNSERSKGKVPANIYAKDTDSIAIWFDEKELRTVLKDVSESTLIDLNLQGESKSRPVILRKIDENMFKPQVIHVDVQQVNLKEKMIINIPVEISGESQVILDGLGLLETPTTEIEVEALPTDLPESFMVDISPLTEIGQQILVKDVTAPKGVEILTDPELIVAFIAEPAKVEEEPTVSSDTEEAKEVAEVETTEEGKSEISNEKSE